MGSTKMAAVCRAVIFGSVIRYSDRD